MKILISANAAWNLVNYRAGLLQHLVRAGHEVVAAAPRDGSVAALQALGVRFIGFPMVGRGTVPEEEWALYRRYRRLLVAERPRAYLGFTIKPNVWGAFAARRAGVAPLLTVTGLGTVFGRKTPVNLAARTLYAGALSLAKTVFFQNASDAARLSRVTGRRAEVLPGSGVDLTHFAPPTRASSGRHFLFLGRLLRQKGVFEFVEAATAVRARYPDARFTLLGAPSADVGPPMLEAFGAAGVDYGCALADVRPAIAAADCLVLPSAYGEGTPHSLLEGAAMGRALIA
ncbi:MAG: glycosyltransferase, partial [Pseudomonadota bacterium]